MPLSPSPSPHGELATFRGPGRLCGEEALVRSSEVPGYVLAQFNDVSTGYGYGWTQFLLAHFKVSEP